MDEAAERVVPPEQGSAKMKGRPVIAGAGPCGLFAGLELAKLYEDDKARPFINGVLNSVKNNEETKGE